MERSGAQGCYKSFDYSARTPARAPLDLFSGSRFVVASDRIIISVAIACTGKWRDLRYGTGSGSDLAPPRASTTEAPGRYRYLYRTAADPYTHLQTAIGGSRIEDRTITAIFDPRSSVCRSELQSGHPLQQSREAADLRDLAEIGAPEAGRRAEEVRVVERIDDFGPQLQREPLREPLIFLEGEVPVFLERRAGARVRARRIAEGERRGRRPSRWIEPFVQAIFRATRRLRILTRNQIGALEAAEQSGVVIILHDDDREATLVRADC